MNVTLISILLVIKYSILLYIAGVFYSRRFFFLKAEQTSDLVVDLSDRGIITQSILLNQTNSTLILGLQGLSLNLKKEFLYLHIGYQARPFSVLFLKNRFDLYDEEDRLIGADECSADNFEHRNIGFFENLATTVIELRLNSNYLKRPICPYLFKNANIRQLMLTNLGGSYFAENLLKFYEIKNDKNASIDLNFRLVGLLITNVYRFTPTSENINKIVFSNVSQIGIQGHLAGIDRAFFRGFNALSYIDLTLYKAGEFFQSSTNEWLAALFSQYKTFPTEAEMIEKLYQGFYEHISYWKISQGSNLVYTFPDEDFCLFKHFPMYKPFLTDFNTKKSNFDYSALNVDSCAVRYLSQTNDKVLTYVESVGSEPTDSVRYNDSMLAECDFSRWISMCFNASSKFMASKLGSYVDLQDAIYFFDWLEYLGPILTFPIFSLLAFILNLLVILIIKSKKNAEEKLFEAKSFRFIKMNSIFNCVECFIYQFRLMGLCLGSNSIFCSSIRENLYVAYFGASNRYLSEVMKTCSILTGLLFSIQRYFESCQKKSGWIKAFLGLETKRICLIVLTYGVFISVPFNFSLSFDKRYAIYDIPNPFSLNYAFDYSISVEKYFYFSYYLINDLLTLILNLIVDCCLVHHIRSDLRQKLAQKQRKALERPSEQDRKKLRAEEKKKTSVERKANAMIIVSVVIYVCCRLPELAGVFFFYYLPLLNSETCMSTIYCYLMSNFIEYLYMFSYMFNILLYYKFNNYFKRGFYNFFKFKTRTIE